MKLIDGKTETLCIFGNPVEHSKSPLMHNALFEFLHINAVYLPYAPEKKYFENAIQGFKALKFRGANITIPYKTEFIEQSTLKSTIIDEISEISTFTGSVNTLYWKDSIIGGKLCATTTDPYGCIRNLEEHGVNAQNKKIALLGNGGAAKAIAYTLIEQNNNLTIVCRTKEKGQSIASGLNKFFINKNIQVETFENFEKISNNFDIIINATSVGMVPNIDESPISESCLHENQIICDIVYTPTMTKLLKQAKNKKCHIVTGEGMLIHQGLESFKKWFPKETKNYTNEELISVMKKGMQK